jgi:hypothetical protein
MKNLLFELVLIALLAAALILSAACGSAPQAPLSASPVEDVVLAGGIVPPAGPFTEAEPVNDLPVDLSPLGMEGLGYVCATKPRSYCHEDGGCQLSTDYYVQREHCPIDLID